MTAPVTSPVTPVAPPDTAPAGNFTNPAFILALIPQIAAVVSLFHSALGVSITGNEQGFAILAAGVVSLGAYLSRAAKHNAHGTATAAWYKYLIDVADLNNGSSGIAPSDDNTEVDTSDSEESDDGTDVPPPLPPLAESGTVDLSRVRTGTVSTTRSAAKKTASSRR